MILELYGAYSAFVNAFFLGVLFGMIYDVFRIARVSRLPYLMPKGKLYEMIAMPEKKKRGKTEADDQKMICSTHKMPKNYPLRTDKNMN